MSLNRAFSRDDGTPLVPGRESSWAEWVSASRTRNFCNQDPVLDWLELYGKEKGFARDDELPGHDARTGFMEFVFRKGNEFEEAVVRHLRGLHAPVRIANEPGEVRTSDPVERTWKAMLDGAEIIHQGVLWNPEARTYGAADLLVRSDILASLFPKALSASESAVAAPDLPGSHWHYRVVDIKFSTLDLLKDGHAAADHRAFMAQVCLYNEALGRLQGLTPPCGYLLGRGWKQLKERGASAMERLARVERDREVGRTGQTVGEIAQEACEWIRRVRREGAGWEALPEPSVDELRPNLHFIEDAPWHGAKRRMAEELEDLTLVPRVSPTVRADALSSGLRRWTDPTCTAERLGISGERLPVLVDAVLDANRSPAQGPIVFPSVVSAGSERWKAQVPMEFYVDFETVSDLDDDFSRIPAKGGQPLIFMVGCGRMKSDGAWECRKFTAESLTQAEEARILQEWVAHMEGACREAGSALGESRLFHWSPAETVTLSTAYNSAAARHGLPDWGHLPWVDLLNEVVKAEPVTVRGAFGFGLKAIAKAMKRAGLIQTVWGDGPTDGLGAMVGAWWCHHEALRLGVPMTQLDLMRLIEEYNEVDCRVMAEVLGYLRRHRAGS